MKSFPISKKQKQPIYKIIKPRTGLKHNLRKISRKSMPSMQGNKGIHGQSKENGDRRCNPGSFMQGLRYIIVLSVLTSKPRV
jgi:hypothetical protein